MRTRVVGALLLGVLGACVCVGLVTRAQGAPGAGTAVHDPYAQSTQDYEAAKAKAKGGTVYTVQTVPDWTGIWRRAGNPEAMNANDIVAALVPKYRAAYEEKQAKKKRGVEWDRLSWCLPMGMPRWLADPWLREFIVTPKQTWMLYEQLQEERRIYTDGRGHISDAVAIALWEGDSIGFWDGDTLVIHTTHMKAGDYWRGSPDFSFQVSTIERVRRVDTDTIEDQLTVYDPVSLTQPVHLTYKYGRIKDPGVRMDYDSCEEGNNNFRTAEGGTGTLLPGEPGYREPTNFGIPDVAIDSRPE
ncbi:MAG: hypothetical protein M3N97_00670 [Pseudomonadota bacterium]|nr:hypothetical protein [Pseudomonadota bacterium]